MAINDSQICLCAPELTGVMTGSKVSIGVLLFNPAIIIFDNQGTASVAISTNGDATWRTFPSGEALVLDLRAAQGIAPNYTFVQGTEFFGLGASGTFSISYVYARDL